MVPLWTRRISGIFKDASSSAIDQSGSYKNKTLCKQNIAYTLLSIVPSIKRSYKMQYNSCKQQYTQLWKYVLIIDLYLQDSSSFISVKNVQEISSAKCYSAASLSGACIGSSVFSVLLFVVIWFFVRPIILSRIRSGKTIIF